MIFTLVLVPVLYVVVERREERRAARRERDEVDGGVALPAFGQIPSGIAAMRPAVKATFMLAVLAVALSTRAVAQTSSSRLRLTLDDAVALAVKQGYATNIANARLAATEARERGAAANLKPQMSVTGNHLRSSGRTSIVVPRGALGNESTGGPIPAADQRFDQGGASLTYTQLSVTQPVTQLWRIRQAQHLASAQTMGAAAERARVESDVRFTVERLYASALLARARVRSAELQMQAARRQNADMQQVVAAGIDVSARGLGASASVLDAELAWTTATDSATDAENELRSALALASGTQLELVAPPPATETLSTLDAYVTKALATSPEIALARADVEQAQHATSLARADYIPDVGVGVTYTMLDGVSFMPRRAVGLSIQGSWTVLDWGKRGALTRERAAQEEAAVSALALARDRVSVEVERAYRTVVRAERAAEVAHAACDARRASLKVVSDRSGRGLTTAAALAAAEAELAESEVRSLAAELQIRIARAALARAVGGRSEDCEPSLLRGLLSVYFSRNGDEPAITGEPSGRKVQLGPVEPDGRGPTCRAMSGSYSSEYGQTGWHRGARLSPRASSPKRTGWLAPRVRASERTRGANNALSESPPGDWRQRAVAVAAVVPKPRARRAGVLGARRNVRGERGRARGRHRRGERVRLL
jgi:outer membrane protein TolC